MLRRALSDSAGGVPAPKMTARVAEAAQGRAAALPGLSLMAAPRTMEPGLQILWQ